MRRIVIAVLAMFVCVSVFPATAQAEARFALLIGNKAYTPTVGPLVNPHTDVDLVAASLKTLGFTSVVLKDATYKAMDTALKRHVEAVRRAGAGAVSFFYYSGHGVANGETRINYLVPVDVADADDDRLWYESFQHHVITDMLTRQAPKALHYMVLDACRNELNLTKTGKKALGSQKGFVPVEYTSGVLIAYATAPGKTAEDGKPGGGPYARALADEIVKPGIEAYTMFRNVGLRVKGLTGQDPWLSSSTLPEVYLAGKVAAAVAPAPPAPSAPAQQSAAAEAWQVVRETRSTADLEAFLARFGDTFYGDLAKRRLGELKLATAAEKQRLALLDRQKRDAAAKQAVDAESARMRDTVPVAPQAVERFSSQEIQKGQHKEQGEPGRSVAKAKPYPSYEWTISADQKKLRALENATRELPQLDRSPFGNGTLPTDNAARIVDLLGRYRGRKVLVHPDIGGNQLETVRRLFSIQPSVRIHGVIDAAAFNKLSEVIVITDNGVHFLENGRPLLVGYEAVKTAVCEMSSAELLSWATGAVTCGFGQAAEKKILFGSHAARDSFLAIIRQLAAL